MRLLVCASLLAVLWMPSGAAQDTRFAYVGVLQDGANAAPTGSYDVRVRLFDGPDGSAAELAPASLHEEVPVEAGVFTLALDFGNAVLAPEAWLELAVRPAGSGGFEVLAPRQRLHGVPTALYAESTDWSGVANLPAGFADGVDDDSLAALGCSEGQVPLQSASGWTCGDPPQGEDGLSVLSGEGAPSPSLGRDGEFYIDTNVHAIYGPKTAGDWGVATSLVGPPGADPGGGGDLEAMGMVMLTADGQTQSLTLFGFSLVLRRLLMLRGDGIPIDGHEPMVERLELLLGAPDFGAYLLQHTAAREPIHLALRVGDPPRLLVEATGSIAVDAALEPLPGLVKGALVTLWLDPSALTLHWAGDSFSWTFRDESGGSHGDGPRAACRNLFTQFGSDSPDDFTGIDLTAAPTAVRVFRSGVAGGTGYMGKLGIAPLTLSFPLGPHSAATEARPTCAANLLSPGHGDNLHTSIAMFDGADTPRWNVDWTATVAESVAIVGAGGELGIELTLHAADEVCHRLPDLPPRCVDPAQGGATR